MANLCVISFEWVFDGGAAAKRFEKLLDNMDKGCAKTKADLYMGTPQRTINVDDFFCDGNRVLLTGTVRWAVEHADMMDYARFCRAVAGYSFSQMTCEYEEIGCMVYGKYTYTRLDQDNEGHKPSGEGTLIDEFLPEKHWPDEGDVDDTDKYGATVDGDYFDSYEEALREALDRHKETVTVSERF